MQRILVCVTVMLALLAAPAMSKELKIGYVDLQSALNMSTAGKAAKEKLKERVQSYDADVQKKQDELKKLKEDLEKQAMLLSEEARNAKERDYQQRVKDYQRFTKDIQDELQQTDADLTRKILEEIFKVVQEYGKQEGYSMIFEKTESSLLYADESVDMTEKVIELFNQQQGM